MTHSAGDRRRSAAVSVSLAALVAAALTGCGDGPDYQGVCVDSSQRRVEDDSCRSGGSGGGHWMYYRNGTRAPAVGEHASAGVADVPHGSSVSRGGFGRGGGVVGG